MILAPLQNKRKGNQSSVFVFIENSVDPEAS